MWLPSTSESQRILLIGHTRWYRRLTAVVNSVQQQGIAEFRLLIRVVAEYLDHTQIRCFGHLPNGLSKSHRWERCLIFESNENSRVIINTLIWLSMFEEYVIQMFDEKEGALWVQCSNLEIKSSYSKAHTTIQIDMNRSNYFQFRWSMSSTLCIRM